MAICSDVLSKTDGHLFGCNKYGREIIESVGGKGDNTVIITLSLAKIKIAYRIKCDLAQLKGYKTKK